MSCWPGDSRALGVLLGFQREIRAFVSSSDRCSLSRVSWWFYQSATSAGGDGDGNASWPSDGQLSALAHRVHSQLARGGGRSDVRRRKTKARLAVGHVRVLLRELLLVACGLRASCLVDCCALTKELAGLLLSSLAAESEYRWCSAVHRVRAVLLDGNVFFVNVDAFVREKMAGPQPLYVNVSASLTQPQLLSNDSNEASRLQAFAEWTTAACRELLRSTTGQVLEWRRSPSLNATALAGILLCYPCVYDVLEDENSSDTDDGWGEHENCLAMCPLVVLQTACLFMPLQQLEIVLHEFSVPRHLLCRFNEELLEQVDAMSFPLVKLLQARCRLKLQHAIEQSSLLPASVQPQVRGHTCTLPRVAL
ncbi:hypothetical protein PF005_g1791 [Phytophthora fragariae]|uniref:Uncharacterized protein n=1 Tax=Phytophthora fragariae TaxID=53985 RepID=A0A6A4AAM7_9STRA|nr:hypothetical protein PF003_g15502 [Phytophthora fragariae]KAE8948619.1 hypothetical protein PF009_g1836 [Phytophthora fragariae]KAE9029003.1 hypothetical protein PF011_g1272 [Phytophthora fragariae]KAE9137047.1 hypothetical protein PF010_g1470 [Phytophthora fragariae]KAE9137175.1 hypothetical protein PF007_g1901 [Phytophthora fragariae]